MKGWVLCSLIVVVVASAVILPTLYFSTRVSVYVIDGPTKQQVETLLRGDEDGLVWFNDASQLYQGSSLIKLELRTRFLTPWRTDRFLDSIGVKYELLSIGKSAYR